MVYIMYMYVNKRVELAQRGIALQKMYVLLYIYIFFKVTMKEGCIEAYEEPLCRD